jgi:type II secretory pathway predicted ATPase ExeA/nucleoid-associated protein YgaU
MFLDYFGLKEQPFGVTPDPRYLYFSETHKEALASLFYGIETGCAFLALIAQPGMGKTTLLSHLIEQLRSSAQTVFLFQTQCGSREFFRYLLADVGIDASDQNLARMHDSLNSLLLRNARSGRRFVLVIDEAQNLDDSVLELVRLLSDFETPQEKLLQVVLSGQPQLADKLSDPGLTQLRQRISIVSQLHPLTRMDAIIYVEHRLSVAGHSGAPLFRYEAIEEIVAHSGGIPRVINNICFNSLTLAYAKRKLQVDASIVREVLSDLDLEGLRTRRKQFTQNSGDSLAELDILEPTDERSYQAFHAALRTSRILEAQNKEAEETRESEVNPEMSGKNSVRLTPVSQKNGNMPRAGELVSGKDQISAPVPAASVDSKAGARASENASQATDAPNGEGASLQTPPLPVENPAPAAAASLAPPIAPEPPGSKTKGPRQKSPEPPKAQVNGNGNGKHLPSAPSQHETALVMPPAAREDSSKEYKERDQQESVPSAKSNFDGTFMGRARGLLRAMSLTGRNGHETPIKSKISSNGTRFVVLPVVIFLVAGFFVFAERHSGFMRTSADAATGLTEPAKENRSGATTTIKGSGKDPKTVNSEESTRGDVAENKPVVVTVEEGQTLSGLALRYQGRFDSEVTQEIQKLNPQIQNPDMIIAGTQLRLPRPASNSNDSDSPLAANSPSGVGHIQ